MNNPLELLSVSFNRGSWWYNYALPNNELFFGSSGKHI